MTAKKSPKMSIGKITPVDSRAGQTSAINAMLNMLIPVNPVFDIPRQRAATIREYPLVNVEAEPVKKFTIWEK